MSGRVWLLTTIEVAIFSKNIEWLNSLLRFRKTGPPLHPRLWFTPPSELRMVFANRLLYVLSISAVAADDSTRSSVCHDECVPTPEENSCLVLSACRS